MRVFNGVDELRDAVGSHIGYSAWLPIPQEQIDLFARATGDYQWIHVDQERAAAGPFGNTIAHGYLTLSLLPRLLNDVFHIEGVTMGVNYGANKLRFPTPVPVGSKVRAGVHIVGLTESSLGFVVEYLVKIEIEGSTRPACVVEMLAVVVP
jgi:acyl dehydratase